MLSEEHYIILENELFKTEKMSEMYRTKSKLISSIIESHDDKLIKLYCSYHKEELTLDEFLNKITEHCKGESFKELVFRYTLSIIAVNEEKSRVFERKTYIVEWSAILILFAPFGGQKEKVNKDLQCYWINVIIYYNQKGGFYGSDKKRWCCCLLEKR